MSYEKDRAKKSRVKTVTIGRLYNLGNYEHLRFEVSAEVPDGGSAKATLLDIGAILAALKPIKKAYNLNAARETLAKLPESLSEVEKGLLEEYRQIVAEYDRWRAARMAALERLDDVGGTSTQKDAKKDWGDWEDDE